MVRTLLLAGVLLVWAGQGLAGDPATSAAGAGVGQELEKVPYSCRQLHVWQERCRLGPCNTKRIETWRERCKRVPEVGEDP